MKLSRILLVAVATVLAAALIAGCGGAMSKAEYEKEMKKISSKASKEMDKLQEGTPTEKDVESAKKTLEDAADDVEAIDPPSEVKKTHDELVDVLRDTAKLMSELKPLLAIQDKDPSKITAEETKQMQEVPQKFADIQERMDKVSKGYADKKYDVGFDE